MVACHLNFQFQVLTFLKGTKELGVSHFTLDAPKGLFKVKLSLFCSFHVENANGLDPLMWWFANQSKFPNVGFLA
jgi:hypothetical protein